VPTAIAPPAELVAKSILSVKLFLFNDVETDNLFPDKVEDVEDNDDEEDVEDNDDEEDVERVVIERGTMIVS
jgi:hypothetical protein